MNVFNGTNKFAGYYQAFSGGKATVKIKRANDSSEVSIDEGFMVNTYNIAAGRGVVLNRFLNMDGAVAQVGTVSGSLSLSGLIGTVVNHLQACCSSSTYRMVGPVSGVASMLAPIPRAADRR